MASIQVETTPNPNSLKFTTQDGSFLRSGIVAMTSHEEADRHELGERLFSIGGVDDVFITPDFVTVSKTPSTEWSDVKQDIESELSDYLTGS